MLGWLRHGVELVWEGNLPPPPYNDPSIPVAQQDIEWLSEEMDSNVRRGAWEELEERPLWCAAGFIVKNAEGKRRVVIDLRFINRYLCNNTVSFDTLRSLREIILPGDFMISMDLTAGYHHIGIHPSSRQFLGFQIAGRYFRCAALPFGLSTAPRIFTKVMRQMVRHLRAHRVRVLPYLDDFLFLCHSRSQGEATAFLIDRLLIRLGLSRNAKKGHWTPTQDLIHLGMRIRTTPDVHIATTELMETRIRSFAGDLLHLASRRQRWVPKTMLQKFTGVAISQWLAVPLARAKTRALYDSMRWNQQQARLSSAALTELRWWSHAAWNTATPLRWPKPQLLLETDAADHGYGAVIADIHQPQSQLAHTRAYFNHEEQQLTIMVKEALAVERALMCFQDLVRNQHVLLRIDNAAAGFALLNLSSRDSHLREVVHAIWNRLQSLNCRVFVRWIASADNARADRLSRIRDRDDWQFAPHLFQRYVVHRFGMPDVDLFASRTNALVPRFWSRFRDDAAVGTDAMAHLWSDRRSYGNPPWRLISPVLRKLQTEPHGEVILLLPRWESAVWWPTLLSIADVIDVVETTAETFRPGVTGNIRGMRRPPWDIVLARIPAQPTQLPSHLSWRQFRDNKIESS